jgi:prevent-host-death family protein
VFFDSQPVREVSISQLRKELAAVVEAVAVGERVIVSRHGRPRAVLVSLDDAIDVAVVASEEFARLRREVRLELERGTAESFDPRWRMSAALRRAAMSSSTPRR